MRNTQEIVTDIASSIRKIEDLLDTQRKTQRIIIHEVKCLHKCHEEALKAANLSLDGDKAVLYSGGTPKT